MGVQMREEILTQLCAIEADDGVRILYACESGSRAWGFPSPDSDYDVRFIYLRPRDWYLSIDLEHKRDVIECPIDGMLDITGWDLRKALRLLRNSNPPLIEWLGSPVVYWDKYEIRSRMHALAARYHSPKSCAHHYLHMAHGNFRDYLEGPMIKYKRYFYVLRPILAINWIERDMGVMPTEFARLAAAVVDDPELRAAIDRLLADKLASNERDLRPRIEPLSAFIESELARLEQAVLEDGFARPAVPVDEFNALFRAALDEVWSRTACVVNAGG